VKMTLFVLCFLCATGAFGQSAGTPSLSPGLQPATHPQHASASAMAQELNLTDGTTGVHTAQGEMPLSEIQLPEVHVTPLGDVARVQKKEHESAKKAEIVWEN